MMVNGGIPITMRMPLHEIDGRVRQIRDVLQPLARLVSSAEMEYTESAATLDCGDLTQKRSLGWI